jgi:RHS repeat-associated protein
LTYDAWNRLVKVTNSSGQIIAQYTYNAMGYRVTESYPQGGTGIPAGEINYIYYDSQWQAIETRTNGTANSNVTSQMVWSAAYINAAILQDSYAAGVIQPNSRLYFLQDANWNTTAIVNFSGAWQVLQQYIYSPYGTITVLNEDGAGSTPIVNNLYQGMTLDPVTGLYYARNRNYSPTLGRWINQDPAGYINGANTYQFVMSNPLNKLDPWGLCDCNNKIDFTQIPVKDFFWNPPPLPIPLYQQIQQDQSLENYWKNQAYSMLSEGQSTNAWEQYFHYMRVVNNLQTQEINQIMQMLAQMEKPGRANEECMNWNAISNGSEGAAIAFEFINAILESLAPLG